MADHRPIEPVQGELLTFHVRSDHDGKPYRVELAAYGGNGTCECSDFQIRRRPMLERKEVERSLCKHLRRAREYFVDELIKRMLQTGAVHDDAKQR